MKRIFRGIDPSVTKSVLWAALFLTGLLFSHTPALSDVYRWVDEKGIVHFSNNPPPEGARDIQQFQEVPTEIAPEDAEIKPGEEKPSEPPVQTEKTETKTEATKSPQTSKPPDSETMTRLKNKLEIRKSTDKQRQMQRRIKAQQVQEGIEPEQDEKKP
jgi:hypothetical protein